MKQFYVSLLWHDQPEGGSFGTIVEAENYDDAEHKARLEMAQSYDQEGGIYCDHCGADADDGEGENGFCGDCADRAYDSETGEFKAYPEVTDACFDRIVKDYADDWTVVDCFPTDSFQPIANAAQAAAETHDSWEARCDAILTALGLDFGGLGPLSDGRPMATDVFMSEALTKIDDHYDLREALKCWNEGAWDEALEYLNDPK